MSSFLTLILASIIYWQAKEIGRVLNEIDPNDPDAKNLNVSFIEHVSPIAWDNVILYGKFVLNRDLILL